jgi:hypothetical protein
VLQTKVVLQVFPAAAEDPMSVRSGISMQPQNYGHHRSTMPQEFGTGDFGLIAKKLSDR